MIIPGLCSVFHSSKHARRVYALETSTSEQQFVDAANEYCNLIMNFDTYKRDIWLDLMGQALLRLEEAMAAMEISASPAAPQRGAWVETETRFDLYSRLKRFLGERDEYWSEGDLRVADGHKTGNLSDDFTDIFFEILHGLGLLEQDCARQAPSLQAWLHSYHLHWQQHLIDARKQLIDFGPRRLKI
jgi:hypothetical protein